MNRRFTVLGVLMLILGLFVLNLVLSDKPETTPDEIFRGIGPGAAQAKVGVRAASLVVDSSVPVRELVDREAVLSASAAPGGIVGVVRDEAGPIADAAVRIVALEDVAAVTDEGGGFRFEELRPGSWDVHVSAAGHVPALIEDVPVRLAEMTTLEVTLEKAQGLVLEVRSAGDGGSPVEGAEAYLFAGGEFAWSFKGSHELSNCAIQAVTDAGGIAMVDQVRTGQYYVIVRSPEYRVWRGDVTFVADGDVIRVDLVPGGVIEGRVLDSTGAPARGSVLIGQSERVTHPSYYYGTDRVEVEADGTFRLAGVPDGQHHLVAVLEDGELATTATPLEIGEERAASIELRATRTATLSGRVTDASGAPLEGATVRLISSAGVHADVRSFAALRGALRDELGRSAVSGPDGRYLLEGVRTASGAIKVVAELEGYADQKVYPKVQPGQDVRQDFRFSRIDSSIAGRVFADFEGDLGGISIVAKMESGADEGATFAGTTDGEGRFEIGVPQTGSIRLSATARGFVPECTIEPRLAEGLRPGMRNVEFELVPKRYLRVRAVDPDGAAVGSLEVNLFDDVEQRFRFGSVQQSFEGLYEVPVDLDRHLFATLCSAGFEPVEIWDLANKVDEVVTVELPRSGVDRRVRVVDGEGRPIAGASVCLEWFGGGAYPIGSTMIPRGDTDDLGEALLRAVPPGAPLDFIVAPGSATAPPLVRFQESAVPTEGGVLILRVESGLSVSLDLRTVHGTPTAGQCVIVADDGTPMTPRAFPSLRRGDSPGMKPVDGWLSLQLLPGRYTLHHLPPGARSGDFHLFEFEVEEGAENLYSFEVSG